MQRGTLSRRGFLRRSLAALTGTLGLPEWFAREQVAAREEQLARQPKQAGPNGTIVMGAIGDTLPEAFHKDRSEFSGRPVDPSRLKAVAPLARDQLYAGLAHVEAMLADGRAFLLGGLPSLAEPHAHLDKAFLAETVPNPSGDLIGAIEAMHAHARSIDVADTLGRAERAARLMLRNGVTAIRTHADLTQESRLTSVTALLELRERLRGLVDVQVCALAPAPRSFSVFSRASSMLCRWMIDQRSLSIGCSFAIDRNACKWKSFSFGVIECCWSSQPCLAITRAVGSNCGDIVSVPPMRSPNPKASARVRRLSRTLFSNPE